ncbi:CBS domain-containing protein [Alteribacter natronophilus]|uniref:CBS domain-containing protein n=1 Tax=Alteribacter natronophilus TaxID=2583810 RepID=UPI00110F2CAB|nr:CBS domain-containing protein [Alteribacter natronophilus]TMW73908.1 CBS domain-containing protein [Alteribacter natronophilus]
MNQSIRDYMSKGCASCSPEQSIQEVAALMEQNDCGAIPVVENGQIRGIITDRDLTLRATAHNLSPDTPCSQCMSATVTVADSQMDVHEAARLMAENQIRRLPVVENGQVVGMLSLGDLSTQDIYANEAGEALSSISCKAHHPNNLQ